MRVPGRGGPEGAPKKLCLIDAQALPRSAPHPLAIHGGTLSDINRSRMRRPGNWCERGDYRTVTGTTWTALLP